MHGSNNVLGENPFKKFLSMSLKIKTIKTINQILLKS
jgi:hypothetical protein